MSNKLKASDLNKRIDIWGKLKFKNELNEIDYKEAKIKTIWASIVPQTGSLQKTQAETVLANTTHKIIVRYGSGKDIKESDFIIFRGKRFDIKFILNPYFEDEKLEIFTEQITE
ncbi:phage head closure protein [Clostridium sp. FP1]|uniref:phage head closure protein n=1 Tax=Clostridium sp. FP1 TaxID=2724076 RepID=UPI0013E95627|nr:phage head closure protein [Clostridium sp. FP1]MBZ9633187.1 phage head closure protein [Clostridium sp. FP1]